MLCWSISAIRIIVVVELFLKYGKYACCHNCANSAERYLRGKINCKVDYVKTNTTSYDTKTYQLMPTPPFFSFAPSMHGAPHPPSAQCAILHTPTDGSTQRSLQPVVATTLHPAQLQDLPMHTHPTDICRRASVDVKDQDES
jgi:hypothetical protein